jgi:UPF0176 protein
MRLRFLTQALRRHEPQLLPVREHGAIMRALAVVHRAMSEIVVAALYHFVRLPDFRTLQAPLQDCCARNGIRGTLLLAEEGINGTISGTHAAIDAVLGFLKADPRFATLEHKESVAPEKPFHRLKVKLKKEIVTMGVPGADPAYLVGTYVDAHEWNQLLSDPDVVVVDTRNQYEVEIGSFKNAVSPQTNTFSEFPEYVEKQLADKKHRKIAMFCTGGIRCEKATSYLKSQDFAEVYHLKGGILRYLETVPPAENLWQGECFVFDQRVTVDKNLQPGSYVECLACRRIVSPQEQALPGYQKGVSCPHCIDESSQEQKKRFAERAKQFKLAEARGERHIGVPRAPGIKRKKS